MIGIYFAVFQLIMKGEIGHGAELKRAAAVKEEEAKKQHGPKKGRPKGRKGRPGGKHDKRGKGKGKAAGDGAPMHEAYQPGVRLHAAPGRRAVLTRRICRACA